VKSKPKSATKPGARVTQRSRLTARRVPLIKATKYLLDGEIAIPVDGHLSFDDLLMRIHPAASRVKKLSETTPCVFIVFDLLVDDKDGSGET
jgi:ATP-dependent DNA ligase